MSSANIILGDPVGNTSDFGRAEAAFHAAVRFHYRKLISAIVKMPSDQRQPTASDGSKADDHDGPFVLNSD